MAQRIQTIITIVDDLDGSQEATTSRFFDVGSRRFVIDLCDANAEQFDAQFREWTSGLRKRTFALGRKTYTRWLPPEEAARFDAMVAEWSRAAKRIVEEDVEEHAPDRSDGRGQGPLEAIIPVPAKGQRWWIDPPRPHSRRTGQAFGLARRLVREWARDHGWPELGTRGVVPHEAYERWVEEVWLATDDPSWDRIQQQPVPDPGGGRAARPRRRK
ncbi:Lsr2 dimerization domain-containing protein [Amycolatopsis sp. CA-126428]|uniref:Lsr2 dimerization domain-containing protein n=1 Tax=Amycolatopsis sp. CA-126428 TaxID=2073158 RepID=UPI000CD060CE|nr:histone-like nucleoid-structuring protein Lsr2 [Amycolatopsis sp. CA-126428]